MLSVIFSSGDDVGTVTFNSKLYHWVKYM